MITVDLNEVTGVCFIVVHPTGVSYAHQCGGYFCAQRSAEGFLVPMENSVHIAEALYRYFYEQPKYQGHCHDGIDAEDAQYIESLINEPGCKWVTVDHARLRECMEAWVYLKLEPGYPCFPFCYNSDPGSEIVMIWENSD